MAKRYLSLVAAVACLVAQTNIGAQPSYENVADKLVRSIGLALMAGGSWVCSDWLAERLTRSADQAVALALYEQSTKQEYTAGVRRFDAFLSGASAVALHVNKYLSAIAAFCAITETLRPLIIRV